MIKPKSLRHLSHYVVLLILMLTGLIALIFTGKSTVFHTTILVFTAAAYFFWGLVHQALEKELHAEIILEYLLFSLLGLALVLGVLYYL